MNTDRLFVSTVDLEVLTSRYYMGRHVHNTHVPSMEVTYTNPATKDIPFLTKFQRRAYRIGL
jgi:hypothetical protein